MTADQMTKTYTNNFFIWLCALQWRHYAGAKKLAQRNDGAKKLVQRNGGTKKLAQRNGGAKMLAQRNGGASSAMVAPDTQWGY